MPDGILTPTETTAPELAADTADSRLVRHVRRNLVLWSGGTTLVILLVLGRGALRRGRELAGELGHGRARLAARPGPLQPDRPGRPIRRTPARTA